LPFHADRDRGSARFTRADSAGAIGSYSIDPTTYLHLGSRNDEQPIDAKKVL
jgi:hypothetical protein